MSAIPATSQSSDCPHGPYLYPEQHIGQLFRDYGENYIRIFKPHVSTIKLIRSIRLCRTAALGGKRISCKSCGDVRFQYYSCGNSQCPQCQGIKRLQWQDRLANRMLDVPYSHITFTLPHQLNGLARNNKKEIYSLLMRSAWKTIKKLCKEEDNVGALPGMTAVLHTWGADLKYHIHAHCLITFGGLTMGKQVQWKWPKRKHKIAAFRKLRSTFRKVFLNGLKRRMDTTQINYHLKYEDLESELMKKQWVVNHQRPTADTKVIEQYLSRYICRIAISNKRLSYDAKGKNVRIEYNDYARQEKDMAAPKAFRSLEPLLAMQLILQHQLPLYFQKVRHYGLHSSMTYNKIKDRIPEQLKRNGCTLRTVIQILKALLREEPFHCTYCGGSDFEVEEIESDTAYLHRFLLMPQRSPPAPKGRQT